jgi:hypothetical protein
VGRLGPGGGERCHSYGLLLVVVRLVRATDFRRVVRASMAIRTKQMKAKF